MTRSTDIKYLSVLDKIYRVTGIQWQKFTLEAEATNLSGRDVPPEEVSDILSFGDFTVRLITRNRAVNT